jgi:hypothetical protein
VLTGRVVVIGGSAVVIVSCGTADPDRPGIAVAATKPRTSRVARQAARLTGYQYPIRAIGITCGRPSVPAARPAAICGRARHFG